MARGRITQWPGWECVRVLGEGSLGKVYEIKREEGGKVYSSALKVITIPQSQGDMQSAYGGGMDEQAVKSIVDSITDECALMAGLKGNTNIVSYEDHMVVPHEDDFGCDILIRMELLTPLMEYERSHPLGEGDVIRLGTDICTALELCARRNIIHRNIKPESIFVNGFGCFKLGNFGVARQLANVTGGMNQRGTAGYMAPEVARGGRYDARADVYSLGLVLYRLMNGNRMPFQDKSTPDFDERQTALVRRMSGEALPPPWDASPALAAVILRACAYDPAQRFASATEMKRALEALGTASAVESARNIPYGPAATVYGSYGPMQGARAGRGRKGLVIALVAIALMLIAAVGAGLWLGVAQVGDTLTATGKDGSWYRVEYNGMTGYVNETYVETAAPVLQTVTVDLADMVYSAASPEDGGFVVHEQVTDNQGTVYDGGIGGVQGNTQCWQEYDLNGEYSVIRGRVVLNYDTREENTGGVYLWIYGDERLIYQSSRVAAGCEPEDFLVDVSGVTTLRLVIEGKNMLRLVNCALEKQESVIE